MKRKPLSAAELEVLKVLWRVGPSPARAIVRALRSRQWAYTTAKTVLDRMEEKGYLGRDRTSAPHIYHPVVEQEEFLSSEIESLSQAVCDGEISPLVRALVRVERLSMEDVHHLRQWLKAHG